MEGFRGAQSAQPWNIQAVVSRPPIVWKAIMSGEL